ncbi:MAG: right-handed parallel beta-helix repeat-containing protein [bacterium]
MPFTAPTIQAGIDSSAAADTVQIISGVYNEYDLTLKPGVYLRSYSGIPEDVIIDAAGLGRALFCENADASTVVEGITFRNGLAAGSSDAGRGGAVFIRTSDITFRDCIFEDNTSTIGAGALLLDDCGDVQLEFCDFWNNTTFFTGTSSTGGAIAVLNIETEGTLTMTNCRLDGNEAGGPGGTIFIENGSLILTDCEITNSTSGMSYWAAGAGVFLRRWFYEAPSGPGEDLLLTVSGCRFEGNTGMLPAEMPYAGDGGGILVKGWDQDHLYDVFVENTIFKNNYNAQGAGLYVGRFSNGLIQRCRFDGNRALLDGGATNKGGAFPECLGEVARYEYCEFIGNDAGYDQAGVPLVDHGRGGAFMTRHYPRGEFINCTFMNNRCGGGTQFGDAIYHYDEGGPLLDPAQQCVLINSVFYSDNGIDLQIRADSLGFSEVTNCAFGSGEFDCPGVTPVGHIDLLESPFIWPDNPHLKAGAPCIDQAVDLGFLTDIEGTTVPEGDGPDVGAYEYTDLSGTGVTTPTSPARLLPNFPNPCNPRTTIPFSLAQHQHVTISLYDLTGRRVAVLVDALYATGDHLVKWNGRDSSGQPAASGTYLVRLKSAEVEQTSKLMLVR